RDRRYGKPGRYVDGRRCCRTQRERQEVASKEDREGDNADQADSALPPERQHRFVRVDTRYGRHITGTGDPLAAGDEPGPEVHQQHGHDRDQESDSCNARVGPTCWQGSLRIAHAGGRRLNRALSSAPCAMSNSSSYFRLAAITASTWSVPNAV